MNLQVTKGCPPSLYHPRLCLLQHQMLGGPIPEDFVVRYIRYHHKILSYSWVSYQSAHFLDSGLLPESLLSCISVITVRFQSVHSWN